MRVKSKKFLARTLLWLLLAGSAGVALGSDDVEAETEPTSQPEDGAKLTMNLYGPESEGDGSTPALSRDELARMFQQAIRLSVSSEKRLSGEEPKVESVGSGTGEPSETKRSQSEGSRRAALAHAAGSRKVWQEPTSEMNFQRFFNGLYYESQYSKINELLVRHVDSPQIEANMAVVYDELRSERKKGVGLFNRARVEALEQLAALNEFRGAKRCDRDAYAHMFKNDKATSGKAHKAPSSIGPLRCIEFLVHRLFLEHAIECFHEYPKNYAELRATLAPEALGPLEAFMDSLIDDASKVTSPVKEVRGKQAARAAFDTIKRFGAKDPEIRFLNWVVDELRGKYWVDVARIGGLVKKYLVAPCQQFVQTLGPDCYIPARFDAVMLEREDRYVADDEPTAAFLRGYIHYRLCRRLIKSDKAQLTKDLVRLVHRYGID